MRERKRMDQAKQQHQALQSLNILMKPKLVMKLTQLILSVYVFSFFFSYSTWLSFLLQCSSNFHFFNFPLQLASHTIDRKCIFLICNGILVFLASNSGLFSSSDPCSESYHDTDDEFPSETQQEQVPLVEKDEVLVMESNGNSLQNVFVEEAIQDKFMITSGGEEAQTVNLELEGEEGDNDNYLLITEDGEKEEDDYEGEENGDHDQLLSTEELNKKFDDFIRRMKEEIKFEARQQLVLVN